MTVRNLHERIIPTTPDHVGALIDALSSDDDPLWPREQWPRMRLQPRLAVGAEGGHGPIRYIVTTYEPGRRVVLRFTAPHGFHGTHLFEVVPHGTMTILRHVLEMDIRGRAYLTWPLIFRPLHDALVEDALDKAAVRFGRSGTARWSPYVRLLRWLLRR